MAHEPHDRDHRRPTKPTGDRGPDRRGLDRRHVRRLLSMTTLMADPMLAEAWTLSGRSRCARAVRCAGLPLRQPEADVPQEQRARRRRHALDGADDVRSRAGRAPASPRRSGRRTSTALRGLAASDMIPSGTVMTLLDARTPWHADHRSAGRAVRARSRRADLPDLGAHLRLQPGVRALPVLVGPARPARADHRAVRGGHRRAAADAGLLRQHRWRRADDPAGLLAPAASTPSTTRSA